MLLAGQAQVCEDNEDLEHALNFAMEAHSLAPDLVVASAIAGRMLAAKGKTSKATRIIQKTWKRFPHPELAVAYAYVRLGDSPKDRLKRVKELALMTPENIEGSIAIANAAIEAHDFDTARSTLAPLVEEQLTQRICALMARIEGEDTSNTGGVREWLARAAKASRDPVWIADGIISDTWQPVSPVSGTLDGFKWCIPYQMIVSGSQGVKSHKIEILGDLNIEPQAKVNAKVKNNETLRTTRTTATKSSNVSKTLGLTSQVVETSE